MSDVQWLQFMTPLIAMLFAVYILASIPLKTSWREHYQLPKRKLLFKKASLVICAIILVSYLIVWITTGFRFSSLQMNIQAISGLILIISLVLLGLITFIRLFEKNNLLSLWLVMLKRQLPFLGEIAAPIIIAVSLIIVESFSETFERQRKEASKRDMHKGDLEKATLNHGMSLNGDYSGNNKSLWYGDSNNKKN